MVVFFGCIFLILNFLSSVILKSIELSTQWYIEQYYELNMLTMLNLANGNFYNESQFENACRCLLCNFVMLHFLLLQVVFI